MRLPTAAEYVRAGRGDATTSYPWGESTGKWELICEGRADDQDRARSLYTFLTEAPGSIQGLCGNVLELVAAPPGVIREQTGGTTDSKDWLLAGGCYEFTAAGCTLDSFLDYRWNEAEIELEVEPGEAGTAEPSFDLIALAELTGFRVIREAPAR